MHLFPQKNLPVIKDNFVIMSGEYTGIINRAEAQGLNIIKTSPCSDLPFLERYHADLQCVCLNEDHLIVLKNGTELQDSLKKLHINFKLSRKNAVPKYPGNVLLNCAEIGKYVFCNQKYADQSVVEYCEKFNKELVSVAQGYTKCSTAVVAQDALITADPSIYHAAAGLGLDVLKIQEGHIFLKGYPYGFIGGCCAKLTNDILAFTGKIKEHPDYEKIKSFTLNRGVHLHTLYEGPLTDTGGMIVLSKIRFNNLLD